MADVAKVPRLNGVVRALREGGTAFLTFAQVDIQSAIALSGTRYDGIVFDMEHGAYDIENLRDTLQYLLDRRQIVEGGTLAPSISPLVRIPPNGSEMNQWVAKQVLDSGAYGVIWPHVSTVEEAMNAVSACRYPRLESAPRYAPPGVRGDGPARAARYWGLTQSEYYKRADVWPLAPEGEVLVCIMCEELKAIKNLPSILKEVPGVGAVLIGEGDLSQELGVPRQYDHPTLQSAMAEVVAICRDHDVVVGHPHVDEHNIQRVVDQGFRWLMTRATTSQGALETGRKLTGRQG